MDKKQQSLLKDELLEIHKSSESNEIDSRSLKAGSISMLAAIILAISAAAPAMCVSGSIGYIMNDSGLAVPLAFLVATIVVILISTSYAQLSERYNSAGGPYSYVRAALGGKAGWWTGWLHIGIIFAMGCIGSIFAIHIHGMFPQIPLWLGVGMIATATFLVGWFGIQLSAKVVFILWLLQTVLFVLAAVITLRAQLPLIPDFAWQFSKTWTPGFGINGLIAAVLLCTWSYVGFEVPAYLGEEVKGGIKAIKKAIPIAAIAIGLTYIIISWLWVASITPADLAKLTNPGTALLDFMALLHSPFCQWLILVSVVISCLTCAFSMFTAMMRMLYDMGRSKALPPAFGTLNKYSSPKISLYFITAVWTCTALFGAYFSVDLLLALLASFACLAYICVAVSNIKDRWQSTGVKAFLVNKFIPLIACAILVLMLASQPLFYIFLVAGWSVLGIIIIQSIQASKGKDFFKQMNI